MIIEFIRVVSLVKKTALANGFEIGSIFPFVLDFSVGRKTNGGQRYAEGYQTFSIASSSFLSSVRSGVWGLL